MMNTTIKKRIEEINSGRVPERYEKTSFGIFPCDWKKSVLKDICEINPKTEKLPELFVYIDLESVVDGKLIQENIISKKNAPSRAQRVLEKNDVIYQMVRPYQKNNFIFQEENAKYKSVASTGYAQLRSKSYGFLYQIVNSEYFCEQVLKKCTGTNYPAINSNALGEIKVFYPKSSQEQSRIAEILMQWDKAIELQEKYIKQLELRKKALMQRLLTPKEGWKKTSLKEVLIERVELASKKNEFVHVTLGKEGVVDKTAQYNRDFLVKNDDKLYKITRFNDMCYNPANLKFGVICVNKYGTAIFSPIYITFSVNEGFNVDFIGEILSSANFIEMIRKYEEGTVYERQAVKPSDFLKGIIFVPEKKVQDRIALLIAMINKDLDLQTQKLDNLIKQRKALQQYLLTGIVRV